MELCCLKLFRNVHVYCIYTGANCFSYLLDKINARVPDIKAFTERNAKAFKTMGIIIDDFNFKANSRGSAIFFNLELLDSKMRKKNKL